MSHATASSNASAQATESQMAMMRGAIALAWVDGTIDDAEKAQLHHLITQNIHFSDSQKEVLHQEVDAPKALDRTWAIITNVHDRAHLINIAMLIFWKDGHYCDKEQQAFDYMNSCHLGRLNVEGLRAELANHAKASRERLEAEEESYFQQLSIPERIFAYLDRAIFG